jgi:hypothetical protein
VGKDTNSAEKIFHEKRQEKKTNVFLTGLKVIPIALKGTGVTHPVKGANGKSTAVSKKLVSLPKVI